MVLKYVPREVFEENYYRERIAEIGLLPAYLEENSRRPWFMYQAQAEGPALENYLSPDIFTVPKTATRTQKCKTCKAQFSYLKDRRRHEATVHNTSKGFLCPEESCARSKPDRSFSRRDNLNNHIKKVHGKSSADANGLRFHQHRFPDQPIEYRQASPAGSDSRASPKSELQVASISPKISSINFHRHLKRTHFAAALAVLSRLEESGDETTTTLLLRWPSSCKADQDVVFRKQKGLREKASKGYRKLQTATNYKSDHFKNFVSELKDLDNILRIGYVTLSEFINEDKKKVPNDLKALYCMLHLCYAMSESTETDTLNKKDIEFAKSASEWKGCLQEVSDTGVYEQDLFDELVSVMWDEMKEGWDFMQSSGWEATFGPDYVNFDPAFNPIDDFDTGDPLRSLSDLLEIDMIFSGTPACSNPEQLCHSLPAARPPWETLVKTLVITLAVRFIQELQEASAMFFYIRDKIAGSTLRTDDGSPPAPRTHIQPNPALSLNQRQDIIMFLQDSLPKKLLPILNAASDHFLNGVINTLHDLEECMTAFLMICCVNAHTFLLFFSDVISRFYSYYHTRFPSNLKCSNDVYNSPNYVSDKRRQEEINLEIPTPGPRSTSECLEATIGANSPTPATAEVSSITQQGKRQLNQVPISELSTTGSQANMIEYRWKNTMGPPKKRRKLLNSLPRATPAL